MLVIALTMMLGAAAEPAPTGQVTAAVGPVMIHRGDRAMRAGNRAAIYPGDRLVTPPGGGATLFLYDGTSLALGPATTATLRAGPEGRVVRLDRGELRAVADGEQGLTVSSSAGQARLGRGILRAAVVPRGLRLWSERGDVRIASDQANPLRQGQETTVPTGGGRAGPVRASGQGWTVHLDDLELAGAAAASRRFKRREAGSETAQARPGTRAGTPGAAATEAGQPTPGQPTTDQANQANQANPERPYQPIAFSQTGATAATASSLALGSISASSSFAASGALFSDAQQDSFNRQFPGNIHLITGQSSYTLQNVRLRPTDSFPLTREYFSIALGPTTTGPVTTSFNTGSVGAADQIRIPHFDAHLVQLTQYGIPDPAFNNPGANQGVIGIAGLTGAVPTAPQITGAVPLSDPRAAINDRATFALGEFALQRDGKHPRLDVRRSDQDRQIIKDPGGIDQRDKVTPNPDVRFVDAHDPKFFPELPTVKVPAPNAVRNPPSYHRLDLLRKAAVTTLLAHSLSSYARRTGQTRFVIDRQVVDISGYRGGSNLHRDLLRNAHRRPGADLMRHAHRRPGLDLRPGPQGGGHTHP